MFTLKIGDRLKHTLRNEWGTVVSAPRRGADHVRMKMDDLDSPAYYRMSDLVDEKFQSVLGASATPTVPFSTPPQPLPPAPPGMARATSGKPPDSPLKGRTVHRDGAINSDGASKVDGTYEGDISVERLVAQRNKLAASLADIDERILYLKIQVMMKRTLEPIRSMAEVEPRCDIAADIAKAQREAS